MAYARGRGLSQVGLPGYLVRRLHVTRSSREEVAEGIAEGNSLPNLTALRKKLLRRQEQKSPVRQKETNM